VPPPTSMSARWPRGARGGRHANVGVTHGVHAGTPRPSAQARRLRLRGAPERASARAGVRAGRGRGDLGRGSEPTRRSMPHVTRRACWIDWAWPPSGPRRRSFRATSRAPELLPAIALAAPARAAGHRGAQPPAHGVREVRSRFGRARGVERRCAQAQSHHGRAHGQASRACCGGTPARPSRTWRCGTERGHLTLRGRAREILPDSNDTDRLPARACRARRPQDLRVDGRAHARDTSS